MAEKLVELFPQLNLIEDKKLRDQVEHCWMVALERGGWTIDDLERLPFSLLSDMSEISLAAHTRNVTDTSIAVGKVMNNTGIEAFNINTDYIVAGGLLHDVGKALEYAEQDGKWVVSYNGRMLRHPISGAALAAELKLPEAIQHIIAVHSYEGDKNRNTTEAWIIHHSDFINFDPIKRK